MAKLIRSNTVSALVADGPADFTSDTGRFTIEIAGRDGTAWHLHLTAAEAKRFVDFVDERT